MDPFVSVHLRVESPGGFSSEVFGMSPDSSRLVSQLLSTCSWSVECLILAPAEVLGLTLMGLMGTCPSQSQCL